MTRRTPVLAAALALTGALGALAPAAAAVTAPTLVPLPTTVVTERCGARNDIVAIDPAWLAAWGDKVDIYPASLTFQGGADGDLAKPSGAIREAYRDAYQWAGTGAGWNSWLLYPGTVAPVLDENIPCAPAAELVAGPVLRQVEVCGPHNDTVEFADGVSAEHWSIASVEWTGQDLLVTLRAKPGFTGPSGDTASLTFTDQVNRDASGKCSGPRS